MNNCNSTFIFQSLWVHLLPKCRKDTTELQIFQRLCHWYHNEGKIDELREATQFLEALSRTFLLCISLKRVDLVQFLSSNILFDFNTFANDYHIFDILQVMFKETKAIEVEKNVNVINWILKHILFSATNSYSLTILIVSHKYFSLTNKCRWLLQLNKTYKNNPKSHLLFINQLSCKYTNLDLFNWSNDQLYEQFGEIVNAKEALNTIQLQVDSIQRQHLDEYTFMIEYLKTMYSYFMQVVTTETDLYTDLISVVQKYL